MLNSHSQGVARTSRVFIVDDHPIVRQGLAMMIDAEDDLQVCGHAEEAQTALQAIVECKPDILIVDISLNGPDGLELVKHVRTVFAELPILVLSMHDEATYAERALRARANGYIMKQEATEKVLVAIRRILNGEIYLSDRMANKVLQQYMGGLPAGQSRIRDLSDRELEVFRLIGDGHGTRQIADELHLSVKTVETYQAHIKEKLLLRTGRELVQQAIFWKMSQE
jgi:DNA-binding NarL/FixJ family response regulator